MCDSPMKSMPGTESCSFRIIELTPLDFNFNDSKRSGRAQQHPLTGLHSTVQRVIFYPISPTGKSSLDFIPPTVV